MKKRFKILTVAFLSAVVCGVIPVSGLAGEMTAEQLRDSCVAASTRTTASESTQNVRVETEAETSVESGR